MERAEHDRLTPQAVLVGGGIPKEEYDELREAVHKALGNEISWFKIYPEDVVAVNGGVPPSGPDPDLIVKAFKTAKMAGRKP